MTSTTLQSFLTKFPFEIKLANQFQGQDLSVLYIVNKEDSKSPAQQVDLQIDMVGVGSHSIRGFEFTPPKSIKLPDPSANPTTAPSNCTPGDTPGPNSYNLALAFRPGVLLDAVEQSFTETLYAAISEELGTDNHCIVHGPVIRSDHAKVWYVKFQHSISLKADETEQMTWEPIPNAGPPLINIAIGPDGKVYGIAEGNRLFYKESFTSEGWIPVQWEWLIKSMIVMPNGLFYYVGLDNSLVFGANEISQANWHPVSPANSITYVAKPSHSGIVGIDEQQHLVRLEINPGGSQKYAFSDALPLISVCSLPEGQIIAVDTNNDPHLFNEENGQWISLDSDQKLLQVTVDYQGNMIGLGTDHQLYKRVVNTSTRTLLNLSLKGVSAAVGVGSRVTQLECQFNNVQVGSNPNVFQFNSSTQVNIVNHQGSTYAPLHFGIAGNQVMMSNLGLTDEQNALSTYFKTLENLKITPGPNTTITYSFPYDDNSTNALPAFGKSSEVVAYAPSVPDHFAAVKASDINAGNGQVPDTSNVYALLDPTNQRVLFQFKSTGDNLPFDQGLIDFTNVQVSGYQGLVFIEVMVQNLPGYWDSTFQIPVIIGNSKLTAELDLGTSPADHSNSGSIGSKINLLSGGKHGKIPYVAIEEEHGINLYGTLPGVNPNASEGQGVRVRKTDLLVPEGKVAIGAKDATSSQAPHYPVFPTNSEANLYVEGGTDLAGDLTVTGTTTLEGALQGKSNELQITGSTTISENASIQGTLTVTQGTTLMGPIQGPAQKDTRLLQVTGDLETTGDLTIKGKATVQGAVTVNEQTTLQGNLTAQSQVNVDEDLTVKGSTNLDSDLTVKGNTTLQGQASFPEGFQAGTSNLLVKDGWTQFYNNTKTIPNFPSGGTSIGYNHTGSHGETNFFNLYAPGGQGNVPAFSFFQVTGKDSASELLTILRSGFVGIGTSSPIVPLQVNSGAGKIPTGGNYFDCYVGVGNLQVPNLTASILATDSIVAARFIANAYSEKSDVRIKTDIQPANPETDLQKLLNIQIRDYRHIDQVKQGSRPVKGVVAQELEAVFPEAVTQSPDFIPDIYQVCDQFNVDQAKQQLTCTMDQPHLLQEGDRVKLINEKTEELFKEVLTIPDDQTFVVKDWTESAEKIFVFGKEVPDFRTVDYHQVAMMGVSAIQQLHQEVAELKQENASLKDQLQQEMKSLREELAALKSSQP